VPTLRVDRSRQAIASATELNSPFELAYVQWLSAILQVFLREFAAAKTAAATAVALSDGHGFQQYAAGSRIFLGLAEAAPGNPGRGMPIVRLGLKSLNDSGFGVMMTLFSSSVALAEALDGNVPQALETVEKALQMNPAELSWRPEAIRIRGELRFDCRRTRRRNAISARQSHLRGRLAGALGSCVPR